MYARSDLSSGQSKGCYCDSATAIDLEMLTGTVQEVSLLKTPLRAR